MKIAFTFSILFTILTGLVEPCPYLGMEVGGENPHEQQQQRQLQRTPPPPPSSPKLQRTPPPPPSSPTDPFQGTVEEAIAEAKRIIANLVTAEPFLGPKFVRLAFHDCVGGCNGCVNMTNPGNFGLDEPIDKLTWVAQKFAAQLTRADIWALAGLTVAQEYQKDDAVPYEFNYYGRTSCPDPKGGPDVPMPSAHLAIDGILHFFQTQFGFDERETVAIMGAHTLGVLQKQNSGFEGSWVPAETNLNNEFYTFIVGGQDEASARPLSQFEQDLQDNSALADFDDQYLWKFTGSASGGLRGRRRRDLQATTVLVMLNVDLGLVANFTGHINSVDGKVDCVLRALPGTTDTECPHSSTLSIAAEYKYNNLQWLTDFRDTFTKMTVNGYATDSCTTVPCDVGSL